MSSKNESEKIKAAMQTTGDVRKFLAQIALAVIRDEVKVPQAAVAVKACEQINASLYSEIKRAAMQLELGKPAPALGMLEIGESA